MSALVLIGKAKSLPVADDRPSDSTDMQSEKARDRFAPIDQVLNRLDRSDEIRACA